MADKATFRCCYCRTENDRIFNRHEMNRGLHKEKTLKVPCARCGEDTVQNELGA